MEALIVGDHVRLRADPRGRQPDIDAITGRVLELTDETARVS
jgi:hypothetical protein